MNTKTFTIRDLTLIGFMAAVICVMAPWAIPIVVSPVPITLGNLAVLLAVYVLGMKKGFFSYFIYFLLGTVGLPVFSGFTGGLGKLAGPTGGYLVGFFFLALIAGYFIDRWPGKKAYALAGMVLGSLVCYLFGTLWLSYQLHVTFTAGLASGVFPYLPGDILKIIAALFIGPVLRRAVSHL